jgi:hypothetical protein
MSGPDAGGALKKPNVAFIGRCFADPLLSGIRLYNLASHLL